MFKFFKKNFSDPETLKDSELEPLFIELKGDILSLLCFNPKHIDEQKRLSNRYNAVLSRILTRHERYFVEIEAQIDTWEISRICKDNNTVSWQSSFYRANKDTEFSSINTELLFYICWFSYLGGAIKDFGYLQANPYYSVDALDFLINDRNYLPAIFLKGLILKYGLRPDHNPDLEESKRLLSNSAEKGIGGAIIELRQFDLHENGY